MSDQTLVMKFGGTSVGTPEAIIQVANIVRQSRQEWGRLVIVTAALAGVTNLLRESAEHAAQGETRLFTQAAHQFYSMHNDVIQALLPSPTHQAQIRHEINQLLTEFTNLCHAISVLGEVNPRAMDAITSLGERMSVRTLAAILHSQGIPAPFVEASRLIVTDANFQSANPDMQATSRLTHQVLDALFEAGQIPVITGSIGATPNGIITTLGRGGDEYTAAILATVLPADELWIWTGVDGVMSADPRLVPEAKTIDMLSFQEVSELSFFGSKLLHPRAIRPAIEAGISLRVRNIFNPGQPGTLILAELPQTEHALVKAVSALRKQRMVVVEGHGFSGVPGVAADILGTVASTGTSISMITQAASEQTFCLTIPSEAAPRMVNLLEATFHEEITRRDINRIWASDEVAILTIVGTKGKNTAGDPSIPSRALKTLDANGIHTILLAQSSSGIAFSLVVDQSDGERALQVLHELACQAAEVTS